MYLKKITLSISIIFTFIISTSFTENNELETKVLFEDKVEIKIPKNWKLKEVSETITNRYHSYIRFESADGQLSIDLMQYRERDGKPSNLVYNTKNESSKRTKELVDFKELSNGQIEVNGRTIHYYEGEVEGRSHLINLYTFFDGKIFQITIWKFSDYKYQKTFKNLVNNIIQSLEIKTTDISYACATNLVSKSKELEEKVLSAITNESFDVTYSVKKGSETSWYRQTFYETNIEVAVNGVGFRIVYDKSNNIPAIYYDVNKIIFNIEQFDNFGVLAFFIDEDIRYSICDYDLRETIKPDKYSNLYVRDSGTDKIIFEQVFMKFYEMEHL